jgi:hypothetical protein
LHLRIELSKDKCDDARWGEGGRGRRSIGGGGGVTSIDNGHVSFNIHGEAVIIPGSELIVLIYPLLGFV